MINYIKNQIQSSIDTKQNILNDETLMQTIATVGRECVALYKNGKKTLLAGNGGSAADAQHIAAELVGRYGFDRPSIPSLALTTDTSNLTAIGNDYGYDKVFSRQMEGMGSEGDLFIGRIAIRHSLVGDLHRFGGHIGYVMEERWAVLLIMRSLSLRTTHPVFKSRISWSGI